MSKNETEEVYDYNFTDWDVQEYEVEDEVKPISTDSSTFDNYVKNQIEDNSDFEYLPEERWQ